MQLLHAAIFYIVYIFRYNDIVVHHKTVKNLKYCNRYCINLNCPIKIPHFCSLPVHVNGAFSVASNRRDLWQSTTTDPDNPRGKWNAALMRDPVSEAYVRLLDDLANLLPADQTNAEMNRYIRNLFCLFWHINF
jgi:hypothetical protein